MLNGYEGPAAIVYREYPDTAVAYYYPTAEDAIDAVQDMCDSRDWHFATTRPLPHPIDHWEVDRFISRDLNRVEAQLRDRQ